MPTKTKVKISHFVAIGDSLTDKGTLDEETVLGIPMGWLSGLDKYSNNGRFTNGLTWIDHASAKMANEFIIKSLKKNYGYNSMDIADAIISKDSRVENSFQNSYTLIENLKKQ
jgi:hypothetical protein